MLRKQLGRPTERYNKWGDARHSFRALMILGDLATNYIREKHPLFANAVSVRGGRQASNSSVDQLLNDSEAPRIISKRGRPKKSAYNVPEENERYSSSRGAENEELEDEEGGRRRRRNAGVPRHFENMVMMDHKKRKIDHREKDVEDDDSDAAAESHVQDNKRKRGRPSKDRPEVAAREAGKEAAPASKVPAAPTKKMGFPEFCEQLRDFFRVIGAWYGVSGPVILHYLREQILPVLRMLSVRQLPKETITDLFLQISRTLSYKDITASFMSLMTIGRGFPFYAAIIHALKLYDPDNLYGMKSMHFFVDAPPIQVITIYLRKVVEALDPATGKETFRQIATLMDEVVCEWKDYSIPLEQRLQKIVEIDRLLPDHCRGLRARLYHVLMLPTTVLSRVLQQQQELDEAHVLRNATNMVGEDNAKLLRMVGVEALKETGIVPSGIPNTVLFNNVAYIKPVTSHPALATLTSLGVSSHVEQPIPVVNRVYSGYPAADQVLQRDADARPHANANNAAGRVQFAAGTSGGLNYSNITPYSHYPPMPQQMGQQMGHQHQQHGEPNKHVYANGAHALANGLNFSNNFPASSYSFNPLYMDPVMGLPPPDMYAYDGSMNPNPYMTSPDAHTHTHNQQGHSYSMYPNMMPLPLPTNMNHHMSNPMGNQMGHGNVNMQLPPPPMSSSHHAPGPTHYHPPSSHSHSQQHQNRNPPSHNPTQTHNAAATSNSAQRSPADESTIAFLKNAHSKVPEQFKGPFLGAVKDLVKSLRDPKTPAEEIEARVLVVSSFVPQTEEALKDEIQRTFTLENFKPYMLPEPAATATAATTADSSDAPAAGHPHAATPFNPAGSKNSNQEGDFTPPEPFPSYFHQYHFHSASHPMQQQGPYSYAQQLAAQQTLQAQRDGVYSNPRSLNGANGSYYNSQLVGRVQPTAPTVTFQAPNSTTPALPPHMQQPQQAQQAQQRQQPQAQAQAQVQVVNQPLARDNASVDATLKEAAGAANPNAAVSNNAGASDGTTMLLPSILQLEHTRTSDMVTNVTDDVSSAAASSTINSPPAVPSIPPLLLSKYPVLSTVGNAGVVHNGGDPAPDAPTAQSGTVTQLLTVPGASTVSSQGATTTTSGFVDWGTVPPLSMQPAKLPESTAAKISAMRNSLGAKPPRPLLAGTAKYNSGGMAAKAAAAANMSASSSVVSRTTVETVTSRSGQTTIATTASAAAPAPTKPLPSPWVVKGVEYPYIPPFPYPAGYVAPSALAQSEHALASSASSAASAAGGDAASSAESQAAEVKDDTDSDGEDHQPANTANLVLNKRKAALAAGPMVQGEDKAVQMQKAIAFYLDLDGTHHELSLTLVSEKFRLNHAKFKAALQAEVIQRTTGWSEKAYAKLDEVLALHKARCKKDSSYTLKMAAEACGVPYFHALVWYMRGKATVNRFRTKPGDFKQKLHDMFLTYYKSLIVKNSSESRASISRRFQMTPALFSRKIMELTQEQKTYYKELAMAQVMHRHPLEMTEISSFPVYMEDAPITGSFSQPQNAPVLAAHPAAHSSARSAATHPVGQKPSIARATEGNRTGSSSVQAYRAYLKGAGGSMPIAGSFQPVSAVPISAPAPAPSLGQSAAQSQLAHVPLSSLLPPSLAKLQSLATSVHAGVSSWRQQQTPDALSALLSGPPVLQGPSVTTPTQSTNSTPGGSPRRGRVARSNSTAADQASAAGSSSSASASGNVSSNTNGNGRGGAKDRRMYPVKEGPPMVPVPYLGKDAALALATETFPRPAGDVLVKRKRGRPRKDSIPP